MAQPTSLAEFARAFQRFEVENRLFELDLRGRSVWDQVRYAVFESLIAEQQAQPLRRRRRSYGRIALKLLRYAAFLAAGLLRGRRTYDLILVNCAEGRRMEGGRGDVFMHPLAEALSREFRILLYDHHDEPVEPADYPCDVLLARPVFLFHRLLSRLAPLRPAERRLLSGLADSIERVFGARLDLCAIATETFLFQVAYERFFERFLRATNPKAVLYFDNGNVKGLVTAANRLGIPTVDCQHSLVTPAHISYHYPPEAFAADPALRDAVPRVIFTYGDYWKPEFQVPARTVPVGYPYFERQAERCRSLGTPNRDRSIAIASVLLSREALARVALELSELLPEFTIYYKLRACEFRDWRSHYPPELGRRKNLVVVDSFDRSLHEFLAISKFQVGTCSTALYEGLAFGLRTFILRTGRYEEVQGLVERGCVFLVDGAAEIAEKIRRDEAPPTRLDPEEIFRSGSRESLRRAVRELVGSEGHVSRHQRGLPAAQ